MIKKVIFIFLTLLFSSAILAEDEIIYLKVNANYELKESCSDFIISSALVDVTKKDNFLILRNIGLSADINVTLTLIKADGSVKTFVLKNVKTPPNKGMLNGNKKHYGNLLSIKTKVDYRYRKTETQKTLSNLISFKKDQTNTFVDIKTYTNVKNSFEKKSPFINSAGISRGKNKYDYKRNYSIGNNYSVASVRNYHAIQLSDSSFLATIKRGELLGKYNINNYGLDYKKEFELFTDYSDNRSLDVYHYVAGASFNTKKVNISLSADLNLENINKKEYINYNKAYNVMAVYQVNKQYNRFWLDNLMYTRENYLDNIVTLNGSVKEGHSVDSIGVNSHLDRFIFKNRYSNYYSRFSKNDYFDNSVIFAEPMWGFQYSLESHYSSVNNIQNHSINNVITKNFYNLKYTGSIVFDKDNAYFNRLMYEFNDQFSVGSEYRFYDSKTRDNLNLFAYYKKDNFSYIINYNNSNIFYGSGLIRTIDNRIRWNNDRFTIDAYFQNRSYASINANDSMIGVTSTFSWEKPIVFSDFSKKKNKKIKFCLDIDYDGKCSDSDSPFLSKNVIIQSDLSFVNYLTDMDGSLSLEFSKDEKKVINIESGDLIVANPEISGDTDFVAIQKTKKVTVEFYDEKNKSILDGVVTTISCGQYYKKQVVISNNLTIVIPDSDCTAHVSLIDNNEIPFDSEYDFIISDINRFIVSPLQRFTLTFYKDKNKNNTVDSDELISVFINNKKMESPIVLDHKKMNQIKVKSKNNCILPEINSRSLYYDKSFVIKCL